MIVYEQWHTAGDLRVCKRCRELHGTIWPTGQGPKPPLHWNCRCYRKFHHTVILPSDTNPSQPGSSNNHSHPSPSPYPHPYPSPYPYPHPYPSPYPYPHPYPYPYPSPSPDLWEWLTWLAIITKLVDTLILWEDIIYPPYQDQQATQS